MEKGKIKIYFGYAAGVGKTYNMLRDARRLKESGVDVVIGYIEPHDRKDTMALTAGFEKIPLREVNYHGISIHEFDVDAAIKRHPDVILVDELAHTNAAGSRNAKRYQDVLELQNHGINVWTTLNVQHLEGLNDTMADEMGIKVTETVPDAIMDSDFTEVKIIDLEPKDLLERFEEGKIYKRSVIGVAMHNFFTVDHLLTLREICLRRAADRINIVKHNGITFSKILVLISTSPTSANLIRVAAQMAKDEESAFTALYIAPASSNLTEGQEKTLRSNLDLVKNLGGTIAIKYSSDIIEALYGFVTLNKITKIIIGKSWDTFFNRVSLEDKIAMAFSNIEVMIVPTMKNFSPRRLAKAKSIARNTMLGTGLVLFALALGLFLYNPRIGAIASIVFLAFLTAFATYFALKNINYKKRIRSHAKVTDCYDYVLHEIQNVTGDDRQVRLARCLSNIFQTSVLLDLGDTEVKVKYKDQSPDVFDREKEVAIRSWVSLNGNEAGAGTSTLNDSNAAYFPLSIRNKTIGVLAFLCQGEGNEFSTANRILLYKLMPLIRSVL